MKKIITFVISMSFIYSIHIFTSQEKKSLLELVQKNESYNDFEKLATEQPELLQEKNSLDGSSILGAGSSLDISLYEKFVHRPDIKLLVNMPNNFGNTPIFEIVNISHYNHVQPQHRVSLLLNIGADVNYVNHQGKTVLDVAKLKYKEFSGTEWREPDVDVYGCSKWTAALPEPVSLFGNALDGYEQYAQRFALMINFLIRNGAMSAFLKEKEQSATLENI